MRKDWKTGQLETFKELMKGLHLEDVLRGRELNRPFVWIFFGGVVKLFVC